jgi:hypothetical protein
LLITAAEVINNLIHGRGFNIQTADLLHAVFGHFHV